MRPRFPGGDLVVSTIGMAVPDLDDALDNIRALAEAEE
jgi:hypothetical protein